LVILLTDNLWKGYGYKNSTYKASYPPPYKVARHIIVHSLFSLEFGVGSSELEQETKKQV